MSLPILTSIGQAKYERRGSEMCALRVHLELLFLLLLLLMSVWTNNGIAGKINFECIVCCSFLALLISVLSLSLAIRMIEYTGTAEAVKNVKSMEDAGAPWLQGQLCESRIGGVLIVSFITS